MKTNEVDLGVSEVTLQALVSVVTNRVAVGRGTHMVTQIGNALIEASEHGEEALLQHDSFAGQVEQSGGGVELTEVGQSGRDGVLELEQEALQVVFS